LNYSWKGRAITVFQSVLDFLVVFVVVSPSGIYKNIPSFLCKGMGKHQNKHPYNNCRDNTSSSNQSVKKSWVQQDTCTPGK